MMPFNLHFWVIYVLCSVCLLALVQLPVVCQDSSHTSSFAPHPGESPGNGDFIEFDYDPDVVIDNYSLLVRYLCSRPCAVLVDVVASSELRTGVVIYKRRWRNEKLLNTRRSRTVLLKFPSIIAYREDFFIRHSIDIHGVMLRAWIVHIQGYNESSGIAQSYHQAVAKAFQVLNAILPIQRPLKNHRKCLRWDVEQTWQFTKNKIPQCPRESDTVDMLRFPHASTGERFGVIRKFDCFINKNFESTRIQRVCDPRFTFSVWIYLLNWCTSRICAIVHHVDNNNLFKTPLLLLTDKGEIVIQVHLESGQDSAFKSFTGLSLRTWYRLDMSLDGRKVMLSVISWKTMKETVENKHSYVFGENILYNDTSGYFVIGGGRYFQSIQGFFGPVKYYRLKAKLENSVVNPLFPPSILQELDHKYQNCESIKEIIPVFLKIYESNRFVTDKSTCESYISYLNNKFGRRPVCDQPWSWEMQIKHLTLFSLLQTMELDLFFGSSDMDVTLQFGRQVFEMVSESLSSHGGLGFVRSMIPYLQISSCCGYHRASYFLAVIHEAGLGVPVDSLQGYVYSLIGAQGDERLSLLHLGYVHMQGIDGYPRDYDLSYSYYVNLAKQTCVDRWKVEETERTLARMLFWGQQGVSKNIEAAAKWYAQSALQMKDAQAMYDFSIVLFKGHGVKKNISLALQMMKQAASKGLVKAINGLGWYYSTYKADMKTAVKYFEKAAQNGSRDAIYNLGILHLNGQYPGKPTKNESAAFQHFYKASLLGHVDAIVETSQYYCTGNLDNFTRNPETAVLMLKNVCGQNGYLGYVIRRALNAYLKGTWEEALLNYLLAAEAGIEVAQTNVAHMCEENPDLGRHHFSTYDCEWRYYNHSTFNYLGSSYGFLKMGDYYYYGHNNQSQDIEMSILMYANAALTDSSQGIFNLAAIIEEGHEIPEIIFNKLGINKADQLERTAVLENLYRRCKGQAAEELLSPCSLALFSVQVKVAWKKIMNHPVQASLAYITGTIIVTAFLTSLVHCISNKRTTSDTIQEQGDITRNVQENENTDEELHVSSTDTPAENHRNSGLDLIRCRINQLTEAVPNLLYSQHVGEWTFTVLGVCICLMHIIFMMHFL
ncbi:protein sel-1 homolog 3 isoform X2 [Amia ocellicauda]|uniref:protein sel-1 homolog 3 isoform X2 n=1 Tax=Amia ocellicauda TaxID=2972642 RepID=UPI003463D2B4